MFGYEKNSIEKIALKYGFETKEVKTILNKRKRKRSFFMEDYTLNPYMGCSFACEYCYVNGSKYADHTNLLIAKINAPELVYKQLKNKAKKKERAIINIGSASESYMEIEKELFLTRDILKAIYRFKFAVHIITKSNLILRDLDILKKIQKEAILPKDLKIENKKDEYKYKSFVSFSFSTTEDEIAKLFEPNVPLPSERLNAIKKLKENGLYVGISFMPTLPYISDSEKAIDESFKIFKEFNVDYVIPGGLTLYGDDDGSSKVKYLIILKKHYPEYFENTKKLFEKSSYGNQVYYNKLNKTFKKIAKKYDIPLTILEGYEIS